VGKIRRAETIAAYGSARYGVKAGAGGPPILRRKCAIPAYSWSGDFSDERGDTVKNCLAMAMLLLVMNAPRLFAQDPMDGVWQGYDGEWRHVSQQLVALAEATPADKFAWRPAAGVRSTSEVYMHIAMANLYLLSVTGPKMPADLKQDAEKTVTSKAEVIRWLKLSLDAVKQAHEAETPKDLARKVRIMDRDATADGMYLRILVHANEHMGQLVAYARMTGVVPPWSK
jgi:uncharacterized damage-inducible protein DinB